MYKLQCQLLWNRTSVFIARRSNIWRSEHNITVVFNERLRVDQAVPCLECALISSVVWEVKSMIQDLVQFL